MNIFQIAFDLISGIGGFFQSLYDVMFYQLKIPFIGNFSVWSLVLGGGLVIFVVWGLLK